jgi:predicted AAA+ superfamily ATPase
MFYHRFLLPSLASGVSRNKVRLLFGARQTGKTALLRHAVSTGSAVVFDLGMAADRRRFETDPAAFAREARALPMRVRTIVVDEIQKVPSLLDEVQNLHDERKSRFQIYLTGSSARKLRRHSSNLLPGRCHTFRLSPVCLWECAGPARLAWPGAQPPGPPGRARGGPPPFPAQDLERTLLYGNLPGIRLEPPRTAAATLAAYVENYLEDEIRREALVRDLGSFSVFLRLAALESGLQVNLARLSQESGVPAATLKNYYAILEDTFAGFWLRPYSRKGRRRLLTTPRFLLLDTGVRNAAAGLPFDRGLLASEGPRLIEQWVGLELMYRAACAGRGHGVGFWRSASGAEVDFVWQGPLEDVPIEVKWTARPQPADARHLETFLDEYHPRARRGLVVCRCERPQRLTDRVTAVPWNQF